MIDRALDGLSTAMRRVRGLLVPRGVVLIVVTDGGEHLCTGVGQGLGDAVRAAADELDVRGRQ